MSKLSHSSAQRYQLCGESWRLHYSEKLRPTVTSANLLLGSALDSAINGLLLKDGKDPYKAFEMAWNFAFINKKRIDIRESLQVVYAKADLDRVIFTEQDHLDLSTYFLKAQLPDQYKGIALDAGIDQVLARFEQRSHIHFTDAEMQFYNFLNWTCLKRKAHLILDAYQKEVIPKIKRIISVQKKVDFDNDTGDSITGYIDFVAEWEDGNIYVLDNKSSSRLYETDAVPNSPQLALYAHHEGLDRAGFIVFLKAIKKEKTRVCTKCHSPTDNNRIKTCNQEIQGRRCDGPFDEIITPKAIIQILLDKVNDNMVNMVMENFEMVNKLVEQGVFLKNLSACNNWYGGQCPYYSKCYHNNTKGLEVVE